MAIMRKSMICNLTLGLLLLTGVAAPSAYGGDGSRRDGNLFATDPTSSFLGANFMGVPLGSYDFGGASACRARELRTRSCNA